MASPVLELSRVQKPLPGACLSPTDEIALLSIVVNRCEPVENGLLFSADLTLAQSIYTFFRCQYDFATKLSMLPISNPEVRDVPIQASIERTQKPNIQGNP